MGYALRLLGVLPLQAKTVDKGHGQREYRRLRCTTALNGYLDRPEAGQVFELERVRVT